jgi:Protein of unknown function (DUF3099)
VATQVRATYDRRKRRLRIRPGKATAMARDRGPDAVLITDAAPSFSTEQHHRRRRYTILMAIHLVGLALSGVLYYYAWWLGLVLIIISTPLPWVAVILANSPSRPFRRASHDVTLHAGNSSDVADVIDEHVTPVGERGRESGTRTRPGGAPCTWYR